jgi:2-polyprenyl-6-methoxyphenol hydroxylase-like FAD-dependent oxidoreductase
LLGNCGTEQKDVPLSGWYSVKRIALLKFLRSHLSDDEFSENSDFSHFKYEGEKAVGAVFKDGSIEYGDLFIGADGINSQVRKHVCEAHFFDNQIDEFVCFVGNAGNLGDNSFRKFKSIKKGMAFGFIPLSRNEHVWFLQFNRQLHANLFDENRNNTDAFSSKILLELPEHLRGLIKNSDFKKGHLWISKELKLLSSYYKANVCLIGDAAHGSISLTSSGVSNGISSAIELAKVLSNADPLEVALDKYEKTRKIKSAKTIEYAAKLKKQFSASHENVKDYYLPLFK